ncbi:unnamed protein product [Sphagnum jensenii]|uniref:NAD(+) synthase [glutamine-hydrolyzing] n=1 Tax=Sphagnum jensenii TaxID=128206 RepID=A0ABP0ZY36_9BRYO
MKIGLAQLNIHVGNFKANTEKIIHALRTAEAQGAELVVYSELGICGYPSRDFLEFDDYISRCEAAIDEIAKHTAKTAVLIGAPQRNPNVQGKDLFNSALLLYQGRVQHVTHKTLLPTYDIFDECRYFESNTEFKLFEFKGKKLAITICEDIWNVGNDNPLYTACPMDELIKLKPDVILNLSASPFSYVQHTERINVVRANCLRYALPMVYVNQVGAQTEIIFDGGSVVVGEKGNVLEQLPFFKEEVRVWTLAEDCGRWTTSDRRWTMDNRRRTLARPPSPTLVPCLSHPRCPGPGY